VTPKLLLADDSVTIQRVIELTFADEDVQVLAVGDGQQAIERVKTERPDIVLADVGMPERDGYEVAAFIKGDPQFAHIPVLLLTGAFEPVDEVRARAVGCDGVLVKPFEPQMVISRVRDLLSGSREGATPSGVPVAKLSEPLVIDSGRHDRPAATQDVSGAGALEAYFDRLDAALANKTSAPPPAPEPLAPAADVAGDVPVAPKAPMSTAPAEPPRPRAVPPPAAPPAAAPVTSAVSDPIMEVRAPAAKESPLAEPSLQEAFAALLAAENAQAQATTPVGTPAARSEPLSNEVIEEICRRVIARMGDEGMRAAVLDAAERLVRDEIARIKEQN
jgi:CheY-like chemotaxis protein